MEYEAGEYGISISTENGLEGLKKALADMSFRGDQLVINLRTIVRNAHSVIANGMATPANLTSLVLSDIALIREYVARFDPIVNLAIYHCSYKRLIGQRNIILKEKYTEKQKVIVDLCNTVTTAVSKMEGLNIVHLDTRLDQWRKDTVVMTHLPVDLLSFNEFPNLRLLESHTGVIKGRELFHTKLRRDSKNALPFNVFTLNMYGDKAMFFEGQPIKMRNLFNKLAEKHKWTAITSLTYMIYNIENDSSVNQLDRELILELSKVKY